MPSVVFVCVANSFRSQMAEAIARSQAGADWEIWSAGSHPGGSVHPLAARLMEEVGLSLSSHRSKGLGELPARQWDYVVTMGCGDACRMIPARCRIDWVIPDPAGLPLEEARRLRDHLAALVRDLLQSHASKESGQ